MLLADTCEFPIGLSLGIIALVIVASVVASLLAPASEEPPPPSEADNRSGTDVNPHCTSSEDRHGRIEMENRDAWQQREEGGPLDGPGAETTRRQVQVANPLGLTMRAAASFVVLAREYHAEILVSDGTKQLSGKSLVDLITLVAPRGTRLRLEARGPDAREAVAALTGLIASRSHGTDNG
jgi:phosphocarrier protein HPr